MTEAIVLLHGAAKRTPDYAQKLIKQLKVPAGTSIVPIYYGDIVQQQETVLTNRLATNPLWKREHLSLFRPFVDEFIWDILQWFDLNTQELIIQRVLNSIYNVSNIHLVLHSWASVIALSSQTHLPDILLPKCHSITTLGCALQTVDLGHSTFTESVRNIWTNFYHSDDLVGLPLNTVYGCKDIEVTDAGPPTYIIGGPEIALAGIAHNCYWNSALVAAHISRCVTQAG